ncbi:flippase [Patescibacteria group bacterium]
MIEKVLNNTIYQIIGKVTTMSITILATIVITRVYGRASFGEFSLMQSWPALFFIIVDFGINAIATRELSKDFSKAGKYLGNIFLIRSFFAGFLIMLLTIVLLAFPYSKNLIFGIRLSLFLIFTQSLFTSMNIIFQTKLRYDYSTISLISGYTVVLASILLFSHLKLHVMWISFSYVVGGLITFFVGTRFLGKLGVKPEFRIDPKLWKFLFASALPLGIMFIFSQMSFKEDEFLLSFLKLPINYNLSNTESVAVYSLPYKVFEVALVVPTFFMNAMFPVMVKNMQESKEKLKSSFLKTIYILASFGVLAGIIGVVLSPIVINILGGEEFNQSILVLRILVSGLILFYLSQPISWLIVTLGKQIYLPFIYLCVAGVNLTLNLIFIPKYSFHAAAIVTHVSEFLILIMLVFAAVKAWKSKYA